MVALAVEPLFVRKRGTLEEGTNFVHLNCFSQPPGATFYTHAGMRHTRQKQSISSHLLHFYHINPR